MRKDRTVKAALYARFRIPEYWIVNTTNTEVVEVFTDPRPRSGVYRRVRTVGQRETLSSETLPEISFPIRDLFS